MTLAPFTVIHDIDNSLGLYNDGFQTKLRGYNHPAGWFAPPTHYSFARAGWFPTIGEFFDYHRAAVRDGMFLDMKPAPGAQDAVRALADLGVRQRVATHRVMEGIEQIAQDHTHQWLANTFDVEFDSVTFTADKWEVEGDLWLDDAPRVILGLDERGLPRMVIDAPAYNQHLPGPRANSWTDVVTHVRDLLAAREVAA